MSEASPNLPEPRVGTRVSDVNGVTLGRVARLDDERGRFDVELSARAEKRFAAADRFVHVPLDAVVDADDHEVTLREEARFVVHPDARAIDPVGE